MGKRLIIEVKMSSPESPDQVQRYLDSGQGLVLYLTPIGYPSPKITHNKGRYLGQIYWEDVCSLLKAVRYDNWIHKEFLAYLEVKGMGAIEKITSKDVSNGAYFFDYWEKMTLLVDKVKLLVEPEWEYWFGKNYGAIRARKDIEEQSILWYYCNSKWKKKWVVLVVEVCPDAESGRSVFALNLSIQNEKFAKSIERDLSEYFDMLKARGWERLEDYGCCYQKSIPLPTGSIESVSRKLTNKVLEWTKDLTRKDNQIMNVIQKRISKY
jgi:hypothetical protein